VEREEEKEIMEKKRIACLKRKMTPGAYNLRVFGFDLGA